jgi:hypothetical protein
MDGWPKDSTPAELSAAEALAVELEAAGLVVLWERDVHRDPVMDLSPVVSQHTARLLLVAAGAPQDAVRWEGTGTTTVGDAFQVCSDLWTTPLLRALLCTAVRCCASVRPPSRDRRESAVALACVRENEVRLGHYLRVALELVHAAPERAPALLAMWSLLGDDVVDATGDLVPRRDNAAENAVHALLGAWARELPWDTRPYLHLPDPLPHGTAGASTTRGA